MKTVTIVGSLVAAAFVLGSMPLGAEEKKATTVEKSTLPRTVIRQGNGPSVTMDCRKGAPGQPKTTGQPCGRTDNPADVNQRNFGGSTGIPTVTVPGQKSSGNGAGPAGVDSLSRMERLRKLTTDPTMGRTDADSTRLRGFMDGTATNPLERKSGTELLQGARTGGISRDKNDSTRTEQADGTPARGGSGSNQPGNTSSGSNGQKSSGGGGQFQGDRSAHDRQGRSRDRNEGNRGGSSGEARDPVHGMTAAEARAEEDKQKKGGMSDAEFKAHQEALKRDHQGGMTDAELAAHAAQNKREDSGQGNMTDQEYREYQERTKREQAEADAEKKNSGSSSKPMPNEIANDGSGKPISADTVKKRKRQIELDRDDKRPVAPVDVQVTTKDIVKKRTDGRSTPTPDAITTPSGGGGSVNPATPNNPTGRVSPVNPNPGPSGPGDPAEREGGSLVGQ